MRPNWGADNNLPDGVEHVLSWFYPGSRRASRLGSLPRSNIEDRGPLGWARMPSA